MRAKEVNAVQVFRKGELIGVLKRTKTGCLFTYEDGASRPLSVAMPLSQREWEQPGDNLIPYFANLLPEGRRLGFIAKREKISLDDMFSLLVLKGDELVGDVQIEPTVKSREIPNLESSDLLFKDIRNKVQDFAGVQDKLSIHKEYRFVQKAEDFGILKFGDEQFPKLVQNELFFMNLAKKAKFDAPETTVVVDAAGEEALYVHRFDRTKDTKSKASRMLHLEDGCQVCLEFPSQKYTIQFHQLAEDISKYCASSKLAKLEAFRMYVFAFLIGNGDLHAKNISIVENHKTGILEIAPVYDMVSTLAYDLDQNMALSFFGKDNNFRLATFLEYAKRLDLPEAMAKSTIESLASVVYSALSHLEVIGLEAKQHKRMLVEITTRLQRL